MVAITLPHFKLRMAPTASEERMSALEGLNVLDYAAGASLDRLIELATYALDAPVAFVSLVDADRQRLISRRGLEVTETTIHDSICSHTISQGRTLVVSDLQQDERFAKNPLVDGEPYLRFYAGCPLIAQNGTPIGALCVMDKVARVFTTAETRQLETLARAAMNELELRVLSGRREPVSGLPNRHQFTIDYAGWSEREPDKALYAVLVDIFDLPRANEAGQVLGMGPLEALIKRAGVRFNVALEGLAVVYHVGVTRFAFLVDLPTAEDVERLVEELRSRMLRPLVAAAVPMSPLFHAGICAVTLGVDGADDVIRRMLIGLHASIADQVSFAWYSAGRDDGLRRGYRLAADAQRGLKEDEFHLVYQPRFRSSDLQPVSAEVLIRWNHPRLGSVSPAEFIPVFERTALMEGVTEWVVDHALDQLSAWRRLGLTLGLSINLSAKDVARADAAERLIAKIKSKGLSCEDVEIEITEGEWLRADSLPGRQLKLMALAGIRLAVDDFGSGYSNFAYLTELPMDILKLDKSLIDNLATDERSLLKARAIIGLAHGLGYITVAEGAETEEQVSLLQSLGCDEIQGFALAKPMSATDLADRLVSGFCSS